MSTPRHLVLVRHGESEANLAQAREREHVVLEPEIQDVLARVDAHQRLTEKGRAQARAAGDWLRTNGLDVGAFDERFVSPYFRAMETAALLGSEALWLPEVRVVERDWGTYGATHPAEREESFPHTERTRAQSGFFARLDGGEAITDVVYRFRDFLGSLARDFPEGRVLVVTHGELMWTARFVLERLLPQEWNALDTDPGMRMGNCCVLEYTRVNPDDPQDVQGSLSRGWARIVNTDQPESSPYQGRWRRLHGKRRLTGAELLREVEVEAPLTHSRGDTADDDPSAERVDPLDRFVWQGPLIDLAPDEVYVPATVEELREGKSGRIIKDPNLTAAERAASVEAAAARSRSQEVRAPATPSATNPHGAPAAPEASTPLDRRTKMARIAAAHDEWEEAWAHMRQELFNPAMAEQFSDYHEHLLDMEATPEMNDDLTRRVNEKLAEPIDRQFTTDR